jgi:hypothetical protein
MHEHIEQRLSGPNALALAHHGAPSTGRRRPAPLLAPALMRTTTGLLLALLALSLAQHSGTASAYTLTQDPACDVAAAVFSPDYDDCQGAYLLEGGENDVTNGDATNIATQLLNDDNIFGDADWTFFGKDDGAGTPYFTVTGLNSTLGSIVFDVAAIEAAFGPTFAQDYDLAVSFKAARNFSLYYWEAPVFVGIAAIIDWTTAGTATNNDGAAQALSHASVYFRQVEPENPPTGAPAPATVALIGVGCLLLGAIRRQTRKVS